MCDRATFAREAAVQRGGMPPNRVRSACHAFLWLLPLVFAPTPPAVADDLETVEGALVLYVGREIPRDGGEIIEAIDEVISDGPLAQTPLRELTSGDQSLARFGEVYSNLSCLAAWRGIFDRPEPSPRSRARARRSAPPFFRPLEGYGTGPEDLLQCPVDQAAEAFLAEEADTAVLSLDFDTTDKPDWVHVELSLRNALGRIALREGEL